MGKRKNKSTRACNLKKARETRWSTVSEPVSCASTSTTTTTTNTTTILQSDSTLADITTNTPSSSSTFLEDRISGIPVTPLPVIPPPSVTQSSFSKKLELCESAAVVCGNENDCDRDNSDVSEQRTIVDLSLLCDFMSKFKCPDCSAGIVTVVINEKKSKGFVKFLEARCEVCDGVVADTYTSRVNKSVGTKFSVNKDVVSACLQLDLGPDKLNKFCEDTNMPGLHHKSFSKIGEKIKQQATLAAPAMFQKAANIVRYAHNDTDRREPLDVAVSFDGSWLTRGHSSLVGVGSVIEVMTGMVLDVHVMSLHCQVCSTTGQWQKKNNPRTYDRWFENHKQEGCNINFKGASGMMEPEAAEILWSRSVKLHNMRYTTMVGDGDSKAFDRINTLRPYGPSVPIVKEECMNHVSKRLGTALRTLVQDCSKKGITLGGRKAGSLTADRIRKLSIYYARAIRANTTAESMRTAILASLHHNYSTDDFPQHQFCPRGESSWCFFKKDLAEGRYPGGHTGRIHTPLDYTRLHQHIWPIYQRLTDLKLLQRCILHATQNRNESLHHCIWARCAKTQFHSKSKVEFAALCAIAEYNFGPNCKLVPSTSGVHSERLVAKRLRKRSQRSMDVAIGKDKLRQMKRKIATQRAQEECLREHGSLGYGAGQY